MLLLSLAEIVAQVVGSGVALVAVMVLPLRGIMTNAAMLVEMMRIVMMSDDHASFLYQHTQLEWNAVPWMRWFER